MMYFQYLNKDKGIDYASSHVACFVGAEDNYNEEKHKYFAFLFPEQASIKRKMICKKWVLSVKELYNFAPHFHEIDWKNHKIIFDLDVTPGHIIFAICTLIRYMEENPKDIFTRWHELNDPKKYKLTNFEKLLFLHHNPLTITNGHSLLDCPSTSFDKFISYKPEYLSGGTYGGDPKPPNKDFDLPFAKYSHFRSITLQQSYTPKEARGRNNYNSDGSFEKALFERTIVKV